MTPNQISGVAEALAELLAEGHAGICEPDAHTAEVRKVFDGCGTVLVSTFWIEPEGTSVVLSAFVGEDGSVTRDDARWPDNVTPINDVVREAAQIGVQHWTRTSTPGVRLDEHGEPHFSSEWL